MSELVDTEVLSSVQTSESSGIARTEGPKTPLIPGRLDPEWSDWVLTQFADNEVVEKDKQKYPRVHGLRRLVRKLIGEIVESTAQCLSPPAIDKGSICPTSFLYTVKVIGGDGQVYTYSDAADVFYYNDELYNSELNYARYPSALACTRAEARCLRKLLGLNVCAAEEIAKPLTKGQVANGDNIFESKASSIASTQLQFLNNHCQRLNIHPWKFLNSGSSKFKSLKEVKYDFAQEKCKELTKLVSEKSSGKSWQKYYQDNGIDLGSYSPKWESECT